MKLDEIIKLVDAGYSKEEISKLLGEEAEATEEAEAEDEAEETTKEAEAPNKSVSKEVDTKAFTNSFDDMLKRMNDSVDAFTKRVQEFNINNAKMSDEGVKDKGIEDIFNDIILPKE